MSLAVFACVNMLRYFDSTDGITQPLRYELNRSHAATMVGSVGRASEPLRKAFLVFAWRLFSKTVAQALKFSASNKIGVIEVLG